MAPLLTIAAWLAIALATYVVGINYVSAAVSWRNKRRGIARHHSLVPLVAQALCGLAYAFSSLAPPPAPSRALILLVAALDPSLWSLLYLPFFLLHRRRSGS